jgi:gliding motility-associated-like protein
MDLVVQILIPNVFTPNGDGENDFFTVSGTNLASVECDIFNRWGQKMFSWTNIKGFWDGRTLSGSEAPDGTYFYMVRALGDDGVEYFKKSGFSLIR